MVKVHLRFTAYVSVQRCLVTSLAVLYYVKADVAHVAATPKLLSR